MGTILPPEYFGVYGLGQSMNQGAALIEQDKEKKRQQALEAIQNAANVYGRGSPEFEQITRQFSQYITPGMQPTSKPFVPQDEKDAREMDELTQAVNAGTATPEQLQKYNYIKFKDTKGLAGIAKKEDLDVKAAETGITAAETSIKATEEQIVGSKINNDIARYDFENAQEFDRNLPTIASKYPDIFKGNVPKNRDEFNAILALSGAQDQKNLNARQLSLLNLQIAQAKKEAEAAKETLPVWYEDYMKTISQYGHPAIMDKGLRNPSSLTPEEKEYYDQAINRYESSIAEQFQLKHIEGLAVHPSVAMYSAMVKEAGKNPGMLKDDRFLELQNEVLNLYMPGAARFKPKQKTGWFGSTPPEVEILRDVVTGKPVGGSATEQHSVNPPAGGVDEATARTSIMNKINQGESIDFIIEKMQEAQAAGRPEAEVMLKVARDIKGVVPDTRSATARAYGESKRVVNAPKETPKATSKAAAKTQQKPPEKKKLSRDEKDVIRYEKEISELEASIRTERARIPNATTTSGVEAIKKRIMDKQRKIEKLKGPLAVSRGKIEQERNRAVSSDSFDTSLGVR